MRSLKWTFRPVVLASVFLVPHLVSASPRMVSVAYNSSLQNPQQIGFDSFHDKLLALSGKRIVVDGRVGNALGSEGAILAGVRSGAVDVAVVSGGVVSAVVPEMGVFDIPFLFSDEKQAKSVMSGPVAAKIA